MVLLKAVNYFRKKLHVSSEYIRQFVPGKTLTGNGWLNVFDYFVNTRHYRVYKYYENHDEPL